MTGAAVELVDSNSEPGLDAWRFVALPWLALIGTYWTVALLLLPLDYVPAIHQMVFRRKCQPGKTVPGGDLWKIAKHVGFQSVTLYPAFLIVFAPLLKCTITVDRFNETWKSVAAQLFFFVLCSEVSFYYTHRLFHTKHLYKRFHSLHHRFQNPVSLEALYFHPVEAVCQVPVLVSGPVLWGSHLWVFLAWISLATATIVLHHSGFDIPLDSFPTTGSMSHFHDFHHKVFNRNYGLLGILDRFHGTDAGWKEHLRDWEARKARSC